MGRPVVPQPVPVQLEVPDHRESRPEFRPQRTGEAKVGDRQVEAEPSRRTFPEVEPVVPRQKPLVQHRTLVVQDPRERHRTAPHVHRRLVRPSDQKVVTGRHEPERMAK